MIIIKDIAFNDRLKEVMEQLGKGAFLTVKAGEEVNTMTIGWGMVGLIWNKPIFQILVRESRHTYDLLERSQDFTVSLPIGKNMKEALAFCGSTTGKNINKLEQSLVTTKNSKKVNTPIIGECNLHFECRILAKHKLVEDQIGTDLGIMFYDNADYHTMYYGEIVACYET